MKDTVLYDKLGISPDISNSHLKREGKKLLMKYHPDKNPNNQEESSKKFIEIKEYLDVLMDPEKREKYHLMGMSMFKNNTDRFPFTFPFPSPFIFQQGFNFHFPQFQYGFPFPSRKEQILYELKVNLDRMTLPEQQFCIVYHHSVLCQSCKCKQCKGIGYVDNNICFLCGGLGCFKNINCIECKGTRILNLERKSLEMTLKKDDLKLMVRTNHSLTIKNIDHDLIIIPTAIIT